MLRLVVVLPLLCTALIAGARPVQAGYDWCSVDPTLTFTRGSLLGGVLRHDVVDVQVLVPLSALPLKGIAHLRVHVPSNVQGTELLNTSVPLLFTIRTSFAQFKPATMTSPYQADLALLVPAGEEAFPVRLLVTNLSTGEITLTEGTAGQPVDQSIAIVE